MFNSLNVSSAYAATARKGVATLFLLLFFAASAFAQTTFTSVQSGNWNSASTWNQNAIPTSADNVIIEGGHSVNVNISNAACASLEIGHQDKATATLNFNANSGLTVTGSVTFGNNGNSLRTGAMDMTYGGRLTCGSFAVQNLSSWTPGAGTVEFTGTFTLPTEFTIFNNLKITSGTVTLASDVFLTDTLFLQSGTFATANNFTIGTGGVITRGTGTMTGRVQGTNAYNLYYTGTNKTTGLERTGTGLQHIYVNLSSGQTLTLDTIFSITDLSISSGTVTNNGNVLNISGSLTLNGTLTGSGIIRMTGSNKLITGTGTISNTDTLSFISGSKTIASGANITVSGPINIIGGITLTNNGTLTSTSTTGITGSVVGSTFSNGPNAILNLSGALLNTGTLSASGTGNTINYLSTSAAQTVKDGIYHHLNINKSGQTATLGGNITVNGNLTITAGTLDVSTNNYTITLKGNIINNGTFTYRNGSVAFNGTSSQSITGSSTTQFHNLSLSNSSGLSLSSDLTVNGTLTFNSGLISTGSYKVIIPASASVSSASSSSYVNGNLQKNFATGSNVNRTFEVGTSNKYLPVTLNFSSVSTTGNITLKATNGEHPQISSACISNSGNVNAYWTITNGTVAPSSYTATFNYNPPDIDNGANYQYFLLGRYSSGWTEVTPTSVTSTGLSEDGISGFGDFAIGETNPKIYTQPANATACTGDDKTFTIAATGSSVDYQWQENQGSGWSNITDGGIYSGATTASLTLTGVSNTMDGYLYRCYAVTTSGCVNSDTSAAASLSFSTSFTIDTQPANASVCSGGSTSFSTAASGAVSGYQWQVNTGSSWADVTDNSTYSGATTTTLSLTNVQVSMSGYLYRCIVQSNCVDDDTTSSASLTTLTPPSLNSHPSNVSTCELQSPVFSISASGSNLTYQWQVSTNSGSSWSDIADGSVYTNTTTASLTLTSVPLSMSGYQFRCVVSGSCLPPVTSNAASVTLSARPSVTLNPSDVTIYYNTNRNASYTVSATGAGSLSYQWQHNTGSSWANVSDTGVYSGSSTNTLNITNAHLGMDQIGYRCLVSGTCSPPDTSATAYLYISFHFTITANINWSALSPTPTSSSTMEVKNGATVTVDVSNAVVGTIQLGRKTNPSAGNGTLVFNSGSYLQVLGPGSNVILGEHNTSGSINMTNGGALSCKGFVINSLGTFTSGSGTVDITGTYTLPTNFTTFNNFVASGPLVTLSTGTTLNGYLNVDTSSTLATSGNALSIAGNLEVNGTLSGTGAITLSGNGTKLRGIGSITNTGTITLSANKTIDTSASLTVAGTVALGSTTTVTNYGSFTSSSISGITGAASTSTWVNEVNSSLNSSGPILATGTLTATATDNTIKYEGTTASTSIKPATYYNLTIYKATKTATLSSAATVTNKLYLEHGTFATGTNLTMGNLSTVQVSAGTMTGTLQGSNTYDVLYTNNSKNTGNEFSGTGLRNINVALETGQTVTLTSGFTTGGNLNITSGTIDVSSNNYNIDLKGNFSNTGGTFVPRAGTVTMSGTSAQTISGTSNTDFYNLTINNSSGVTLSTAAQISGKLALSGGVLATGTNLTALTDAHIEVGDGSMSGTIQGNNPYDVSYISSSKSTGAELSGSNVRDITITVNSGQTVTMSSAMTVNRNLTVNANTTLDVSANNYVLNLKGNFTNNGTFNARSGKFSFVGTSAQTISGSSSNIFHKMALSNASGLTLSSALQVNDSLQLIAGTLIASTNLTMGTGATIARSGGNFSGTLQGTNAYDVFYSGNSKTTGSIVTNSGLRDVKIGLTGGQTLTLNSSLSLSRNLLISTGTLDVSASNYAITVKGNFTNNSIFTARSGKVTFDGTEAQSISGSASITFNKLTVNKSADTLKLGRNVTISDSLILTAGNFAVQTYTLTLNGAVTATSGSLSSSSAGTVNYNQSTAGQSVLAANYGNLTFSNYNKTLASSGAIGIAGTFTTGSATGHTLTGSTVDFNGTTQNIPTFTFNNLTISGGGVKTLTGGNTAVNGILNLSNGKISTDSNVLIIESGGSVTGASSSNYVSGNLRKHLGTGSNVSRTFEIGNSNSYLPVDLTFTTVSASGYVTASTTDGDHPQISSSCINPDTSANRYWQLSSTGGLTFDNYSATATFVNTDEDAGADYNNYRIAVYTSSWANPTVGNTTSTSTTATGLTSLGDIQIGEANPTAITANPADSIICNGSNTQFAITAIGTELSYQWQEYNGSAWSDLIDNGTYSGSATDTLDLTAAGTAMNGYKYRCVVSAPCTPNDTSAEATLTINEAPEITAEPADTVVFVGNDVVFQLEATGSTLTYQWQEYDGNTWSNISDGADYAGTGTDSLTILAAPVTLDGYRYRCVVSGTCEPNDTSYAALLTVTSVAIITSHPADGITCSGSSTSFTVAASGYNLNYQWEVSADGGSNYSELSNTGIYSGADTDTLILTSPTTAYDGYKYRCIVWPTGGDSVTSNAAALTVNATGRWLGSTSSDWHTAGNWCGGVPTSGSDIVIPASAANMPVTSSAVTINKLTIDSGASLTMGAAFTVIDSLTLNGSFTIGSNTLTLEGLYSGDGTLTGGSSSNLTIAGTAAQFAIPAITLNNLTFNRSNGAIMSGNITVGGTLTLTSGELNVSSGRLTLNGGAIAGTPSNLITSSSSTLVFGGNSSGITIPSSVTALKTLIINNINNISLSANLTISDSLVFQKGKLLLNNYSLTVESSGTITGYDTTKYVVTPDSASWGGYLKRHVSNNQTWVYFPIGTENSFSPAKVQLTNGSTADNFRLRVFDKVYENGTTGGRITDNVVNKTWLIEEEVTGGSDASIDLGWRPSSEAGNFRALFAGISHFTTGKWRPTMQFQAFALQDACRWRSESGITSFSPFTVVDDSITVNASLQIKAFLEGAYSGGSMGTELNAQGIIPTVQPFNTAPWNYTGVENAASIPANAVDWVLVELRNADSPSVADESTIAQQKAGFILGDGSIVGLDGSSDLEFDLLACCHYYIVIYHRNHLPVMSSAGMTHTGNVLSHDFTTGSGQAYSNTSLVEVDGVFTIPAGIVETVTPFIVDEDDTSAAWNSRNQSGYLRADCNLDGIIDATDRSIILNNQNKQAIMP